MPLVLNLLGPLGVQVQLLWRDDRLDQDKPRQFKIHMSISHHLEQVLVELLLRYVMARTRGQLLPKWRMAEGFTR